MAFGLDDMALIAKGISDVGSAFTGGGGLSKEQKKLLKYKKWMSQKSFEMLPQLEEQMFGPVDMAELMRMAPLIAKGIAPMIKGVGRTSGARFGIRSPMTTGAIQTEAVRGLSLPMASLYSQRVMDRYRKLSEIYGGRTGLASI